jgi:hypothetical protein
MSCATEVQSQTFPCFGGTSVALEYVDARFHAAFVDTDPLVENKQSDYHLVNKEYLPRKSFTFRADKLIG